MGTEHSLTRRDFIRGAGAVTAGLVAGRLGITRAFASERERPNILFCIGDDWAYPFAGAYGDKVVDTAVFDRLAAGGVLFNNAFCSAPTCTASRAAILTGQAVHRLEESANLRGILRARFPVYPDILESAGYQVGYSGKGWDPGWNADPAVNGGRKRNPAGPKFNDFDAFADQIKKGTPFCFWFGSSDPHRPYVKGSGVKAGMKLSSVVVPPYLPDTPEVRGDILDYYFEAARFNKQVGRILERLKRMGAEENTIVVMTGDNGWPFPRGKTNLYDAGTRQPLAIRWPKRVKAGHVADDLVGFTDFAPTFLEAAGLKPASDMTGRSLMPVLLGGKLKDRSEIFIERERHTPCREGGQGYPMRAIRTRTHLYIRNFTPTRWPAGNPDTFGDIDGGPTKKVVTNGRGDAKLGKFFTLACEKRPPEELYDVAKDPHQLHNVVDDPTYASVLSDVRKRLGKWMENTADPRAANPNDDRWDRYPYGG